MCEYHTALDDSDLNHQKCLQFAPLDFCYGVGRKAIHPCTGFCGVMALLIALSYEEGNRLCMSCFFHSKKKKVYILRRNNHVSLSASMLFPFL